MSRLSNIELPEGVTNSIESFDRKIRKICKKHISYDRLKHIASRDIYSLLYESNINTRQATAKVSKEILRVFNRKNPYNQNKNIYAVRKLVYQAVTQPCRYKNHEKGMTITIKATSLLLNKFSIFNTPKGLGNIQLGNNVRLSNRKARLNLVMKYHRRKVERIFEGIKQAMLDGGYHPAPLDILTDKQRKRYLEGQALFYLKQPPRFYYDHAKFAFKKWRIFQTFKRIGFEVDGPKGTYYISDIRDKSWFKEYMLVCMNTGARIGWYTSREMLLHGYYKVGTTSEHHLYLMNQYWQLPDRILYRMPTDGYTEGFPCSFKEFFKNKPVVFCNEKGVFCTVLKNRKIRFAKQTENDILEASIRNSSES